MILQDTHLIKLPREATGFWDEMLTVTPFFFLILHFPLPHTSSGSKTECFWIFPVHLDWVWGQCGRGCAGPP